YALLLGDDSIFNCFFFFQAEDGIRDFHVTGVQTCAFPISARRSTRDSAHGGGVRDDRGGLDRGGRVARPVRGVRERLGGGARRGGRAGDPLPLHPPGAADPVGVVRRSRAGRAPPRLLARPARRDPFATGRGARGDRGGARTRLLSDAAGGERRVRAGAWRGEVTAESPDVRSQISVGEPVPKTDRPIARIPPMISASAMATPRRRTAFPRATFSDDRPKTIATCATTAAAIIMKMWPIRAE